MGEVVLILGGARSGKTRLAERLAHEQEPVVYIATATLDPADPSMVKRIERHRSTRPQSWTTLEVPRDLERHLPTLETAGGSVVIDCVTLWLTNLMLGLGGGPELDDQEILSTVDRTARISSTAGRLIWVSNEVGSGVVPDNALARRFADLQGWANQILAEVASSVFLSVAGLPLRLK
jgi:adenosylcobinamide kinase/adenosylcobinamide-phosphate guanylyltransferase